MKAHTLWQQRLPDKDIMRAHYEPLFLRFCCRHLFVVFQSGAYAAEKQPAFLIRFVFFLFFFFSRFCFCLCFSSMQKAHVLFIYQLSFSCRFVSFLSAAALSQFTVVSFCSAGLMM